MFITSKKIDHQTTICNRKSLGIHRAVSKISFYHSERNCIFGKLCQFVKSKMKGLFYYKQCLKGIGQVKFQKYFVFLRP